MKKIIALLLVAGLAISVCGCSSASGDKLPTAAQGAASHGNGELSVLCMPEKMGCNTEDGYYYLTEDCDELRDGNWGTHLMYMDFATQKEVYLCSTSGCKHDTADCPAVFLQDQFPEVSTRIFVYKGKLYVLSKPYDKEGIVSVNNLGGSEVGEDTIEAKAAVLYRMGLDGTDREKVYTFDSEVTVEDCVLGDKNGIYVITKKLKANKNGNNTYTTSSKRELVQIDPEKQKEKALCSLDFKDHISWEVFDCYEGQIILKGTDYGKKLSQEELLDDDAMKNLNSNSKDVYATLDSDKGSLKEIARISNKDANSAAISNDMLCVSSSEKDAIQGIHMKTGERKTISRLSENCIYQSSDGVLCCQNWDTTKDATLYFVDTKTGKVRHCGLVTKTLGWNLEFCAALKDDYLVIYDYKIASGNKDGYDIAQYKYGLISKKDLYAGKDNYRPIAMIGKGK